jgi:SAM-dependent methyltransferase
VENAAGDRIHPLILKYLEAELKHRFPGAAAAGDALNVLDFGCGSGGAVLALRRRGFNAYGADVVPTMLEEGERLLSANGFEEKDVFRLIDANGRTSFPDGFFHAVVSDQVFEHVAESAFEPALRELARVSRVGAVGFHSWPAQFCIIEPHLHMPFVHWLPKNGLRRVFIALCIRLGMGAGTEDERRLPTVREKTQFQYLYSCRETFYRPYGRIVAAFRRNGFEVTPLELQHPELRRLGPAYGLLRQRSFRRSAETLLQTFHGDFIRTRRK